MNIIVEVGKVKVVRYAHSWYFSPKLLMAFVARQLLLQSYVFCTYFPGQVSKKVQILVKVRLQSGQVCLKVLHKNWRRIHVFMKDSLTRCSHEIVCWYFPHVRPCWPCPQAVGMVSAFKMEATIVSVVETNKASQVIGCMQHIAWFCLFCGISPM